MKPEKKPWNRQKGETALSYSAFVVYLQMDNRSIQKVADLLSKNRQQIDRWANAFDWRERAAAYDDSIVEAMRQDKIRRQKKALARKEHNADLLQSRAEEMLKELSLKRGSFRAVVEMFTLGNQLLDEAIEKDPQGAEDNQLTINITRASRDDNQQGS